MSDWEKALLGPTTSIRDTLENMGESQQQISVIVDDKGHLLGTVTDGDVRRSILQGVALEDPVKNIMHRTPITASPSTDRKTRVALMRKHSILQLVIVDDDNHVVGLVRLDSLVDDLSEETPNWAVIMAGGIGSRLRPLTNDTPKPLLSVGGRPILETIINNLAEYGLLKIYISINYKAEMIKDHFEDGEKFGVQIRYIEENAKLGTAGALGLIKEKHDAPLLIMNGDLLTKINFSNLLAYHYEQEGVATVCVREFDMQVPFGVIELKNDQVDAVIEKPVNQFLVNAGIYVIDPSIVQTIKPNEYLDMPDLLRTLVRDNRKVVAYPIHEYWIDIGQTEDFGRAGNEFSTIFS